MTSIFNVLLALLLLAAMASEAKSHELNEENSLVQMFENWKAKYGRQYSNGDEHALRFEIFKNNVEFIESFNKQGNHSYKLGINKFADMANEEGIQGP